MLSIPPTNKFVGFLEGINVNICEKCGKEYETYAIVLDCNPLSIASFIEEETKPDGAIRHICEDCRKKEG